MNSELLKACETRKYKKNDIVLRQNEEADGMYIINSGNVSVAIDGEHVTMLEKDDFFGEMGLMLHQPRNATIKVVSDELVTQFLSKENFEKVKEQVGEEVIAKTLERLNDNYSRHEETPEKTEFA